MDRSGHKADINKRHSRGQTALHYAVQINEDEEDVPNIDAIKAHTIAQLYYEGAQLDIADEFGKTPITYAQENRIFLPIVYQVILAMQVVGKGNAETEEFKKAQAMLVEHYLSIDCE